MAIKLELLGYLTVELDPENYFNVGAGSLGHRAIYEAPNYRLEGERIQAVSAGRGMADWSLTDATGITNVDVRGLLRTDDDALIYMSYKGKADFSKGLGSQPITGVMSFETSAPKYSWLNSAQAAIRSTMPNKSQLVYEVAIIR